MDLKQIKGLIKNQNRTWIKIKDWEFLYQKLGGYDIVKMGAGVTEENRNTVHVDILLKSIIDWKNVKLSDIIDINDLELDEEGNPLNLDEDVKFDQEVFDAFVGNHLEIIGDLFSGIDKAQNDQTKKTATRKKK